MCGVIHLVSVVSSAGRALVPGVMHIVGVNVVQSLRPVVRLNYLDSRPVLDQPTAQSLANF